MRKRESLAVSLTIVVVLVFSSPAFAALDGLVGLMYDDDTSTLNPVVSTADVYDGSVSPPAGTAYEAASNPKDAAWSTDGDKLVINAPDNSYYAYNSTPLASASKWSVEFEVKLHDAGTDTGDDVGLAVDLRNGGDGTGIVIAKNYVTLRSGDGSTYTKIAGPHEANNTSNSEGTGFNRFRMAYDGTNIYVWRDELDGSGWKPIADETTGLTARSATGDLLNFGDFAYASSNSAVHAEIDYMVFDLTGAYGVPEPATMFVMVASAMACLLRKRG